MTTDLAATGLATIIFGLVPLLLALLARLALGGGPATLIGAAVWQTAQPVLGGGAVGILAVLVLARVIGDALYLVPGSHNGVLFGVTTTDPAMLVASFVGLQLIALIAAALPAQQITRIDPMQTLTE